MINAVNTAKPLDMPAKPFMDSASASFFGVAFQENTQQFATLETAQMLAKMLGGTVVDQKDQWRGGSQTSEYGIQIGADGPILNAGLVAARCQMCGMEAGLSAVTQEIGSLTGKPISLSDAWALVQKQEAAYLASTPPTTPVVADPITLTTTTAPAPTATTPVATDAAVVATTVAAREETAVVDALTTPASTSSTSASNATPIQPSKLAASAKQFEALMIGQMLKSVREASSGGWMGSDGEESHFSAVEFAEGHLSEAIATRGGFGLAKMVLDSVSHQAAKAPSSDAPTGVSLPQKDS